MKSKVNAAGNYTKPTMRKALFESIKAGTKAGKQFVKQPKKIAAKVKAYR
jgi:hypothetical protein